MMQRFNFYDVYGYLIPGATLLALLWLPYGLLTGKWPPADLMSAAVAVGLAYLIGHMLRPIAEAIYPSKIEKPKKARKKSPKGGQTGSEGKNPDSHEIEGPNKVPQSGPKGGQTGSEGKTRDRQSLADRLKHFFRQIAEALCPRKTNGPEGVSEAGRLPSEILLDKTDLTLAPETKERLILRIREAFGVDAKHPKRRLNAFFLCRSALVTNDAASYAEQFEGLHAMLRALTLVCGSALVYNAGWVAGLLLGVAVGPRSGVLPACLGLPAAIGFGVLVVLFSLCAICRIPTPPGGRPLKSEQHRKQMVRLKMPLLCALVALGAALALYSVLCLESDSPKLASGEATQRPALCTLLGCVFGLDAQKPKPETSTSSAPLVAFVLVAVSTLLKLAGRLFHNAHLYFSRQFAKAVYESFCTLKAKKGD